MKSIKYDKLIRDKIPEIIEKSGKKCIVEVMDDETYMDKLSAKLTEELGRGMRLCEGKDFLRVFDFVDNGNIYNAPYSLHRLIGKKEYRPGETVLGTLKGMQADEELYRRGEKPEALIDYPINALDFEIVDIFNWQQLAEDMISQM